MMMNLICRDDSAEAHAPAPPALSGFSAAALGGGVKPTCGTSEQTPSLTEHIGGFSGFDSRTFSLRKQAVV